MGKLRVACFHKSLVNRQKKFFLKINIGLMKGARIYKRLGYAEIDLKSGDQVVFLKFNLISKYLNFISGSNWTEFAMSYNKKVPNYLFLESFSVKRVALISLSAVLSYKTFINS